MWIWGFFSFERAGRQIQPYTSNVTFSVGSHKALIPAVVGRLRIVHEVAGLMVGFVNIGGARCTSWRRLVLAGCLELGKD